MRRPPVKSCRKDVRHHDLTAVAIKCGRPVVDTSSVGGGCPDIFVYDPRIKAWHAVEFKTGDAPQNADQRALADRATVWVIRTTDDMLTLLQGRTHD